MKDLDWLIGQLKQFSNFFDTRKNLFPSEDHARQGISNLVNNHVCFIADQTDVGPIGFIAGLIGPHLFNPKIRMLTELFWWVDEQFRGGRAGLMLLNHFTDWGKKHCDWIVMSIETHSPVNTKCLSKRGFKLKEQSYLMEVN